MRVAILIVVGLSLCSAQAAWACKVKVIRSPDHAFKARIVSVAPACQEDQVEITKGANSLASKSFTSPSGSNGYVVAKSGWSRDSRYFVFDLESSGGHSPLNSPTYVFDREGHGFGTFDAALGDKLFTSPGFTLKDHDRITLTLWSIDAQKTIKRSVDLSKAAPAP